MVEEFRKKLKEDGRSLAWFHAKYLADTGRKYISFAQQAGGFSTLQKDVELAMIEYLNKAGK